MILDICSSLAELMAPANVETVVLDTEPLIWEKDRLYVYPLRVEEVPFETGNSRRQNFDINAVYVVDNGGEEAQMKRTEQLGELLDTARGLFMAAVRQNQATELWSSLRAMSDTASPRTLGKRSAAIRVSGWRVIAGGV